MEMMRKETEELKPEKNLQTRRKSRGLTYFNRLKPKVTIDIGTLDDWYTERTLLPLSKRRRLNATADDIEVESDNDGESDEEMVELNRTAEQPKLDKSLLYETWQEDFEKEKKLLNKKKRKRSNNNASSVRSKSRSPTPTKSDPLQYQISRKASVKNSNEESKNTCSAPMLTDSEEER